MLYHHLCLRGLGGSWHGRAPRREVVLAVDGPAEIKRAVRLLRVLRHVWTAGGAVGVEAAEAAARVGRSRGAAGAVHRQGCDRPHAAQFPAVQGGVHGQFIDRVLDIPVVLREGTHSAYCAEDCSWRRRLCDQQRQFPQSRVSNPVHQIQFIL